MGKGDGERLQSGEGPVRCFLVGVGVLVLVMLTGGLAFGQDRSAGAASPGGGAPAQLGSQRSVAPPQPGATDAGRKRNEQLRRGLVAMVVLTLIVIAFLLFLMVLTTRWTRRHLPRREVRRATSLEDLWMKVQSRPATDEEIARMLSEGSDKEKPKDGEPKTS